MSIQKSRNLFANNPFVNKKTPRNGLIENKKKSSGNERCFCGYYLYNDIGFLLALIA